MKHIVPLTAIAALAASGAVSAQIPAYSKPSGYVTQTLLPNQFTLIGLTLHNSAAASGTFETVSGTSLTDSDASFAPVAGRTYVLEITSGPIAGAIQAVPAASIAATTITTTDNLDVVGLDAGASYALRIAPTLEEIFGTTSLTNGGNLFAALNSNTADILWVGNGNGGFNKYFLHTSGEFRAAGTTTATPQVPVIYADALYVEKRSASSVEKELVLTGQVKTTPTINTIGLGFNALSIVSPVGSTLRTSGLANGMFEALSPNTADNLWVPQEDGTYIKYFRRSGQWRLVSDPGVDLNPAIDPPLPSAVLIERRSATPGVSNIVLEVPESYDDL